MKKKIIWMLMSFLLVAALVLSSCVKEVPGEQEEEEEEEEEPVGQQEEEEEEEEEEEPAVGEPQYGGTITVFHRSGVNAGIPDPCDWAEPGFMYSNQVCERIIIGDVEKYGAGGTGEFVGVACEAQHPLKYSKGNLAESWEVTADKIVLHIRRGVYWTGLSINPVMEKRLYTAHDFVFNLIRFVPSSGGAGLAAQDWIKTPYEEHIYAEDDYTVVIDTKYFHPEWDIQLISIFGQQLAPETVEAGPREFENLVGTGPFYIKEFVHGSSMTYGANPYYWRTATINGKEYPIPFVDEMIAPIIDDETTVVAALRTGTLDCYLYVDVPYVESLAKTNPELKHSLGTWPGSFALYMKLDEGPPLDDVRIRRALFRGTDLTALARLVGREEIDHYLPIWPGMLGYIPMEELPASAQELYDYDPDKARQLIADIYPDGLELDMFVFNLWPYIVDAAEMVSGMWEEIGVDVNMEVITDAAVGFSRMVEADYHHTMVTIGCVDNLSQLQGWYTSEGQYNISRHFSEEVDELYETAMATVADAEREVILKELNLLVYEAVPLIPISYPPKYYYWWPWLKNYYGDGWGFHTPCYDLMWLDQDMKTEMGY